jgi:hypothetical protein
MVQPEYKDALFLPQDNRENFKQIIAKRSDLVRFARGRLGPSQIGSYLVAGTVLGFATSGGDSGYLKPYVSSATDGSQVAVGVLSEDANVQAPPSGLTPAAGPAGYGSEVAYIRGGDLFQALLIGLDSNAITNLKGSSYLEGGNQILHIDV